MEFVVFKSGGKQYKVKVGDVVDVDRISSDENKSVELSDILLWASDSDLKIGKPTIDGAKIKALVVGHKKGDKVRVAKYKAKVRYRKVIGFRAHQTTLRIDEISVSGKASKKESTEGKAKTK